MSIEEAMQALTSALNANTSALKGAPATPATPAGNDRPAARGRPRADGKAAAKPSHSRSELVAILSDYREKHGVPAAKKLIKDVGGADKLVDVPDANVDALFNAADEALAGNGGDTADAGDGL